MLLPDGAAEPRAEFLLPDGPALAADGRGGWFYLDELLAGPWRVRLSFALDGERREFERVLPPGFDGEVDLR